MVVMVEAACHRCGYEWDYTGGSDHYGTCPNCKTSVKLARGSERAEPSETAERCPDPSDRTTGTVEVEGEEVPVPVAVETLARELSELSELGEARGESLAELGRQVEERGRSVDDLERGLQELAGYFKQVMEEAGGEVEYDHIEPRQSVREALKSVDMEGVEA